MLSSLSIVWKVRPTMRSVVLTWLASCFWLTNFRTTCESAVARPRWNLPMFSVLFFVTIRLKTILCSTVTGRQSVKLYEWFQKVLILCGPGWHCADSYQYSARLTYKIMTKSQRLSRYYSVQPYTSVSTTKYTKRSEFNVFLHSLQETILTWPIAVISNVLNPEAFLIFSTHFLRKYCRCKLF